MDATLEREILRAKELVRSGDADGAVQLADELIGAHPEAMQVWLLRGYLHERTDNHVAAAADLTRAIELNSGEPHLFYTRGRYRFQLGDDAGAVEDFDLGLELCDRLANDYYREEAHFWRAEALIRLGKIQEALQDLSRVNDDYRTWTHQLRTKRDLLKDCQT
jgi:tetratricopeptide (TPR) repeat protein